MKCWCWWGQGSGTRCAAAPLAIEPVAGTNHGIPSRHARFYLPTHSSYGLQYKHHGGLRGIYQTEILSVLYGSVFVVTNHQSG